MSLADPGENVVSMEDFLRQTLQEVVQVDQGLHQIRDHLKTRLYALTLARDEDVVASVREVERRIRAGEPFDDGLPAEEFVRRCRDRA